MRGGISIKLSTLSKKREVTIFLDELHNLLGKKEFDPDTDLLLIVKTKHGDDLKFSTPYTILDLEYDNKDVVERLKELRIEEYSETKIDKDNITPPKLFVFGKMINGRLVYVKLKIVERGKQVLCVSFHYARDEMDFPYA